MGIKPQRRFSDLPELQLCWKGKGACQSDAATFRKSDGSLRATKAKRRQEKNQKKKTSSTKICFLEHHCGAEGTKGTNHQVGSRRGPSLSWEQVHINVDLLNSTLSPIFHLLTLFLEHYRLQRNLSFTILPLTGMRQLTRQHFNCFIPAFLLLFTQSSICVYKSSNQRILKILMLKPK